MSEMAPERPIPPLCLVCSTPLPEQFGPGRPRKVCRDDDSPTPGGCARFRDHEQRKSQRGVRSRTTFTPNDRQTIARVFDQVGHGFIIEQFRNTWQKATACKLKGNPVPFMSRPLTCKGFSDILDLFGFSSDAPEELAHLAANLATERTTHPVFEAIVTHMDDCDHCLGIDDDLVAQAVEATEFAW